MSISIDPEIIRRAVNNAMITNGIKLPIDIYNEEYTKDYLELKENSILEQQYEYRN
jgi:predicted nuclease with TOPRIM domain